MRGPSRHRAAAILMLALALPSGCTAPKPPPPPKPVALRPPHPALPLTINTPLHIVAANPRAKAVLKRDIPGLMANRSYPLFDDMSLAQIASVSGGRFTQAKLMKIQADLAMISPDTAAPK